IHEVSPRFILWTHLRKVFAPRVPGVGRRIGAMGLDCNPPDIAWYASSAMCGVRRKATVFPATRGFGNRLWQTIPYRLDHLSLRFANIRVHDANRQIKCLTKELLHFAQYVRVRRMGRPRTDSALC